MIGLPIGAAGVLIGIAAIGLTILFVWIQRDRVTLSPRQKTVAATGLDAAAFPVVLNNDRSRELAGVVLTIVIEPGVDPDRLVITPTRRSATMIRGGLEFDSRGLVRQRATAQRTELHIELGDVAPKETIEYILTFNLRRLLGEYRLRSAYSEGHVPSPEIEVLIGIGSQRVQAGGSQLEQIRSLQRLLPTLQAATVALLTKDARWSKRDAGFIEILPRIEFESFTLRAYRDIDNRIKVDLGTTHFSRTTLVVNDAALTSAGSREAPLHLAIRWDRSGADVHAQGVLAAKSYSKRDNSVRPPPGPPFRWEYVRVPYISSGLDALASVAVDDLVLDSNSICRLCAVGITGRGASCDDTMPASYRSCGSGEDCPPGVHCSTISGLCVDRHDACNLCQLPSCNQSQPSGVRVLAAQQE